MKDDLFGMFSQTSTEEWQDRILKDLKGKPLESLYKKTPEGVTIKPVYRAEDLPASLLEADFSGADNSWKRGVWFNNIDETMLPSLVANHEEGAFEILRFDWQGLIFPNGTNYRSFANYLNFVETEKFIAFGGQYHAFIDFAVRNGLKLSGAGLMDLNPVRGAWRSGMLKDRKYLAEKLSNHLKDIEQIAPGWKGVAIDLGDLPLAGASATEEIAVGLALLVEYLDWLTEGGWKVEKAIKHFNFVLPVGTDFFVEVTKFRVFRSLLQRVLEAYGISEMMGVEIHAASSEGVYSILDPNVNMLRATTMAMAGIIGGADAMYIMPYDGGVEQNTDFSVRVAANLQQLLKYESSLDQVIDPAAGAYFFERLSAELADNAWAYFEEIENSGGIYAALKAGTLQARLQELKNNEELKYAKRKHTMVGVNDFPSFLQDFGSLVKPHISLNFDQPVADETSFTGVRIESFAFSRVALPFEELRVRTERAIALGADRPRALLARFGKKAFSKARANFSLNLLGCAGIECVEMDLSEAIEEGGDYSIVVLCSDNEAYKEIDFELTKQRFSDAELLIAGKQDDTEFFTGSGVHGFIYAGMDIVRFLTDLQDQIGIEKSL